MAQPKRLRDALDRNLAVFSVTTTGAAQPTNPGDTVAQALAVVMVGEDGAPGGAGSNTSPIYVAFAQGTIVQATATLVAATASTILTASATRLGARVLNWTASPVYVNFATLVGTPNSTAPSDYIPAAAAGVPGQLEPPFSPVNGIRAVGASAGDLTVISW